MGRMLGAFDDDNNLDRPDLNKCPDCSCFFAGANCPICGNECPEEFRAGNRKPEKKKKEKMPRGARYIDWYHRWWFIILMLFFMPIVGIILLVTSPHEKWKKILVCVLGGLYMFFSVFSVDTVITNITNMISDPVDTSISQGEYMEKCKEVSPEEYYRNVSLYEDEFVTMKLTVEEKVIDYSGYYSGKEYTTYYLCSDGNGGSYNIMIRDCVKNGCNFIPGDTVAVYGEGRGSVTIEDGDYRIHTHPCIYVAYFTN